MSIKNLQTRIALKYDTYANWTLDNEATQAAKTNANLVLLKGEIGLCEIPANENSVTTAPTVLFKVGDGTNPFKSLNWTSAKAADVYNWAKAAKVELVGTDIVFKDASGNIVKDAAGNDVKVSLDGFVTDAELNAAVSGLEGIIGLDNGRLPDNSTSVVDYVNKKTTGIATSKALEDLQDEVNNIKENIIGPLPEDYKTIVEEIEAAEAAGVKAADDLAKGQVKINTSDITNLKSARETFNTKITAIETALEGVTTVMDFAGAVEAVPTDFTGYQKGDVIVVTKGEDAGKEFVFDGSAFVEFGNSSAEQAAIADLQQDVEGLQQDVKDINAEINGTITTAIAGVTETADGAAQGVADLKAIVEDGNNSNDKLRTDITGLQDIVGRNISEGLQKRVAEAESDIAAFREVDYLILNCGSATECTETQTA